MFYGMVAHRFHLPPYQLVKTLVPQKQAEIPREFLETPKEYLETDVEELIQIHLKFLDPASGHPVKYLIEPVVIVINHLQSEFGDSSVAMVGISGGGWTTTLAAAIDTRIDRSFPVAGTYPIYLRSNSRRDWGDYEQNVPEVYETVNYLELYVLGSYGPGRKQLQIINQFDSCCFAGVKWETYKDIVRERVRGLGAGEFDLFLDDTHRRHMISEVATARILDELRRVGR